MCAANTEIHYPLLAEMGSWYHLLNLTGIWSSVFTIVTIVSFEKQPPLGNQMAMTLAKVVELNEKPIQLESSFEEAVEKAGNGIFHFALLLTTGTALLGVVIEGLNMAFVLPAAKCELAITTSEQGLINAVAFLGVVLTSHIWGFMADTWGRRKVLQLALGSGFAFSALSSLSVSSTMLLVTRFCVGLTISGVQAAAISYLGEFHCNKNRARQVTFAAMFMTISIIYQPLMGLFIMPRSWEFSLFGWMLIRPWRMYILISSCTSAIAFVAISFLPESPKFQLAMGRPEEAVRILSIAYAANGCGKREDFPVQSIRQETIGSNLADVRGVAGMLRMVWKQTRPLLHRDHRGNVLMLCFLTFAVFAVAHGYYMWLPQVLTMYQPIRTEAVTVCGATHRGFANATATALLEAVAGGGGVAGEAKADGCQVAADPLTYYIILVMGTSFVVVYSFVALNINRFGMKWLLSSWLAITTITTGALLWTDNFYLNIALLISMHTSGSCGSVLSGVAADLFPTHFKGMALCFVMMSGRIGAVVGSNVVAALLNGNCDWIFGIYTGLLAVSSGVCYYLLRKKEILERS